MTKKKKLSSKDVPHLHHVDDKNKIVYVHVGSFLGSMAAHVRGQEIWPDYEIRTSSQDLVEYLNGEDI